MQPGAAYPQPSSVIHPGYISPRAPYTIYNAGGTLAHTEYMVPVYQAGPVPSPGGYSPPTVAAPPPQYAQFPPTYMAGPYPTMPAQQYTYANVPAVRSGTWSG